MRHGLECDDWDPASPIHSEGVVLHLQTDAVKVALDLPMEMSPGSRFSYCSSSTVVLGAVLSKASRMSVPEFSEQYLFGPMDITSYRWMPLYGGWTNTGGSMEMLPRDMAKLGLMVLQNGNWNGEQIISEGWINRSTEEHLPLAFNLTWGSGYGYLWWLSDVRIYGTMVHSFAASGAGGQVITVFPELDMVVVITGGNYETDEGQPFQLMERFILPAVLR